MRIKRRQVLLCSWLATVFPIFAQQTEIQYLSGPDKDNAVPWQFYMTGGGRSNNIETTIPVPSCWQTKGFGNYGYGNNGFHSSSASVGHYRKTFSVPADWAGKRIFWFMKACSRTRRR